MITTINNPNLMNLNKRCELYYIGNNVFVPMAHCSTKQLAQTLDGYEVIDLAVEFQASRDENRRAKEIATYTKRMNALCPIYNFTGFAPKVVNGYELSTMTGRLKRCI